MVEIDPSEIEFPSDVTVSQVLVEPTADDEDVVRVWIVVPDDTPERQLEWPDAKGIEQAVKQHFAEQSPRKFPVIRLRTSEEFDRQSGAA